MREAHVIESIEAAEPLSAWRRLWAVNHPLVVFLAAVLILLVGLPLIFL